jgi:type II secretory pathway component PulF
MAPHLFIPSITLLLLGLALRVSLRLLYGARGPAADDGVYLFMRAMSWAMILLPTIIFLVGTTHWVSMLLLVAVFEAVVELVVARRQARRESAWRLLLMAMAGGQPLAESLRYHESRFRGIVGRWYRRLIADLEHGAPLLEAVWANRAALPREAPVYASLLTSSGAPRQTAARISETEVDPVLDVRQHIYQRIAYLATIVLLTATVLSFVMIKIVPSFQEIFADFGLELPKLTLAFISFSETFGPVFGIPMVMAYVAIVMGGVIVGFLYLVDVPALQPVLDYIGFSHHRALLLRLLAASIEQGVPLGKAFSQLQDRRFGYPSPLVRSRLNQTSARIDAGHEWTEAMRRSSLVSATDAALLRTAQDVGNLPWAMRMLAERKLRLMSFRWSVIETIAFSAIILLIGMFVAWYAIAMFIPLIDLVNNMSG